MKMTLFLLLSWTLNLNDSHYVRQSLSQPIIITTMQSDCQFVINMIWDEDSAFISYVLYGLEDHIHVQTEMTREVLSFRSMPLAPIELSLLWHIKNPAINRENCASGPPIATES